MVYTGMETDPNPLQASDYATIKKNGGSIITNNGFSYQSVLPNPITDPSQIDPSVFATFDIIAANAQEAQVLTIISFNALSGGAAAGWMTNLAGGDNNLLEAWYFTQWSAVAAVNQSIKCLAQALAARYASYPYVGFNFFNEPFYGNPYLIQSQWQQYDQGYAAVISDLASVFTSNVFLADAPATIFGIIQYGGTPTFIGGIHAVNVHSYVDSGEPLGDPNTPQSWEWYLTQFADLYHAAGNEVFVGEFGWIDGNGNETAAYPNWRTLLASQVGFLQTLDLWGWQWWAYTWITSLLGKSNFSSDDVQYILTTVLGGQVVVTPPDPYIAVNVVDSNGNPINTLVDCQGGAGTDGSLLTGTSPVSFHVQANIPSITATGTITQAANFALSLPNYPAVTPQNVSVIQTGTTIVIFTVPAPSPTPTPKPSGSISVGGVPFGGYTMLPEPIVRVLWRFREKYIRREVHKKLHPLV